jgi:hypothetical protein
MTFDLVSVDVDPDAGNPDSSFPQNRRVGSPLDSKHQFPAFAVNAFAASRHKKRFLAQYNNQNLLEHTVHSNGKCSLEIRCN